MTGSGCTKVEREILKWEKERRESKKGNESTVMTIRRTEHIVITFLMMRDPGTTSTQAVTSVQY